MIEFNRESDLEKFFARKLKELGCRTDKFTSPAKRGVPDRLVILPSSDVHFVELKTVKGALTKLQAHHIADIRSRGCVALCLWGRADVEKYIHEVKEEISARTTAPLPTKGSRFYQENPEVRFVDGLRARQNR